MRRQQLRGDDRSHLGSDQYSPVEVMASTITAIRRRSRKGSVGQTGHYGCEMARSYSSHTKSPNLVMFAYITNSESGISPWEEGEKYGMDHGNGILCCC